MEFEVWFPQSYHPAIKSNLKKFQEIPVAIGVSFCFQRHLASLI